MRTAEEVVIGDLDRTIGRIKAMRALAIEGEEIEACGVSQSLCEALRVILFEQVEVKNKLISKLIPRKINEVRGQLEYFEELLMTEVDRDIALVLLKRLWKRELISEETYVSASSSRFFDKRQFTSDTETVNKITEEVSTDGNN